MFNLKENTYLLKNFQIHPYVKYIINSQFNKNESPINFYIPNLETISVGIINCLKNILLSPSFALYKPRIRKKYMNIA